MVTLFKRAAELISLIHSLRFVPVKSQHISWDGPNQEEEELVRNISLNYCSHVDSHTHPQEDDCRIKQKKTE